VDTPAVVWIVLAVLGAVLTALLLRRRVRAGRHTGVSAPPRRRQLAEATDTARRTMSCLAQSGPRASIIACYAALERALSRSAETAPQDSDTATEVLGRAAGSGWVRRSCADRLLALFAEARFSVHQMSEEQRRDAELALEQMLEDLRR
ncbi:MAG: DUF4129 domain-containing protein, partial [Sciscionella sp.]